MVTMHCATSTSASHTFGSMTSNSEGGVGDKNGCVVVVPDDGELCLAGELAESPPVSEVGLSDWTAGRSARSMALCAYRERSKKEVASIGDRFLWISIVLEVAGDVEFSWTDWR
jgi:hypothetical protein